VARVKEAAAAAATAFLCLSLNHLYTLPPSLHRGIAF